MPSIGGLISGLDTSTIISQLMQIEAQPQTQLKGRVTTANAQVGAYQSINTRLASALAAAQKLAKDETWNATRATASVPSVTASSTPGAVTGAITFDVTSLASAHFTASSVVGVTDSVVAGGATSLTISQNGVDTVVALDGEDVVSVAKAINAAGTGVRATALQVADGQYRLQLTSKTTGSAGAFTVTGLQAYDEITRAGTDAEISLGGGLTVKSADGRFADVLPGTTFSVSKLETGATVSVAGDAGSTTAAVKALVDSLNTSLQEITSRTRTKSATDKSSVAGPLVGDALVRGIKQSLLSAVNAGGTSPAAAGIETSRTGEYTFDAAKFEALLASDPAKARGLVAAVAAQVDLVTKSASDPTTGTVTSMVTRRQDSVKDLTTRVDAWDSRLASRRSSLERQYATLETALGKLQSQSSWLAGQLSTLPKWE